MKNTTLPAFATLHRSHRRVALSLLALLPALAVSATAQTTLVERDFAINDGFSVDVGLDAVPIDDLDGDNIADLLVWSRGGEFGQLATEPLFVQTLSGLTLETLQSYPVPASWVTALGATPIADRDGDGLRDVAVHSGLLPPEVGEVLIFSSATGQQIQALPNGLGFRSFGADVLDLGDVNGDGIRDLAVSEPERPASLGRTGSVYVLSGANDQLLYTVLAPNGGQQDFGRFLLPLGDLDGDGVQDFSASVALSPGSPPPSAIFAVSGATGSILWGVGGGMSFGTSLAILDDMDGDGTADIAGVYDGNGSSPQLDPRVLIVSGATGSTLSILLQPGGSLGCDDLSISRADDLDGDGLADLAVGVRPKSPRTGAAGRVDFISSATGAVLGSISGDVDSNYGASVAVAADLNEDGVSELIVGGSRQLAPGDAYPGYVAIVSPVDTIPLTLFGGLTQFDNSTGTHTTIGAFGSPIAADNDVTLFARNMPPGSFGYFITSPNPSIISIPRGAGFLFMIGPIGRFVGPGQIQAADATGRFSLEVDLTQWPSPFGFMSVLAGETRYFQSWNRDLINGLPASRLSDRLVIEFQ